jgi:hypothetical protein
MIESFSLIAFLIKTNRSFRIGAMKMTFYRTALCYTQYSDGTRKQKTGSAKSSRTAAKQLHRDTGSVRCAGDCGAPEPEASNGSF